MALVAIWKSLIFQKKPLFIGIVSAKFNKTAYKWIAYKITRFKK